MKLGDKDYDPEDIDKTLKKLQWQIYVLGLFMVVMIIIIWSGK